MCSAHKILSNCAAHTSYWYLVDGRWALYTIPCFVYFFFFHLKVKSSWLMVLVAVQTCALRGANCHWDLWHTWRLLYCQLVRTSFQKEAKICSCPIDALWRTDQPMQLQIFQIDCASAYCVPLGFYWFTVRSMIICCCCCHPKLNAWQVLIITAQVKPWTRHNVYDPKINNWRPLDLYNFFILFPASVPTWLWLESSFLLMCPNVFYLYDK